jgi:predicted PurR-regulated permease PerM
MTAAAWFLLKELAPLLRPLLLAVLFAYVILPVGVYVKGQFQGGPGHLILLAALGVILAALGVMTYADVADLGHQLPRLHERFQELTAQTLQYATDNVPKLTGVLVGTASIEEKGSARLQEFLGSLVSTTASALFEGLQVLFS